MKHLIVSIFSLLCLCTACDKMPQNGALDGQWQLLQVTSLSDQSAQDVKADMVYLRFSLDLMEIYTPRTTLNGKTNSTMAHFRYEGNTLAITDLYIHYRDKDTPLTMPLPEALQRIGLREVPQTFTITALTSDRLILQDSKVSLTFRKF